MSLCASCGLELSGDGALCYHHAAMYGDDWAHANRIICDFFHRGIVPERLSPSERTDETFWTNETASADVM